MGAFQVGDLSGNDIGSKMRKEQGILDPATRPKDLIYVFDIADRLVKAGRLGQKTARGWYDYEGRKNKPSKAVEKLVEDTRTHLGIHARKVSDQEILERCLYALVNEG